MKLSVWQKDMTVIADFAREVGAPTPLFAATAPIYTRCHRADGDGTPPPCAVLEDGRMGGEVQSTGSK
jgi:3-hydroxyisobutyrate dehydrogenase-like beta-hydroxyacid dehydrogenase